MEASVCGFPHTHLAAGSETSLEHVTMVAQVQLSFVAVLLCVATAYSERSASSCTAKAVWPNGEEIERCVLPP